MIDNHHIKRLRMIGHLGQRFIGTKREGKFSGGVAERERQGVRHAKLVVNAQDVQRLSHGDCIYRASPVPKGGGVKPNSATCTAKIARYSELAVGKLHRKRLMMK